MDRNNQIKELKSQIKQLQSNLREIENQEFSFGCAKFSTNEFWHSVSVTVQWPDDKGRERKATIAHAKIETGLAQTLDYIIDSLQKVKEEYAKRYSSDS